MVFVPVGVSVTRDSGLGFAVGLRGEICREKERKRGRDENENKKI